MTDSDPITRLNAALEGRYRIESELGEGGMANVYLADDLKHERKVALKVLKPELAAVVGADRFLAEIKTTANLSHPHILPLFDSGEADGFLFYVMPHVEGETLRDRLDRDHQLPVNDAVQIAKNVAEALDYAHAQGVIHRDIKPANILLQAGKPVISDFGIALAVGTAGQGRLTETGLSMGTPHYMSPEQATGDLSVGAATDVYALGCVLYEVLVGEPPYTGSTAQAILGKIIAGKVASAAEARASVPANVDAAIRKALEKVPADRFGRVNDFGKALADPGFRHGETAAAGSVVGGGPWKRLTMITTATTALFALAFVWSLLSPEPPPAPQPVARFLAPFGAGQEPNAGIRLFNLAPDGSLLVYQGPSVESGLRTQLWVRRWDDLEPSPLAGTEDGREPVVSPDGGEVAFNQGGEIKVVSLQGGPVRTLMPGVVPAWGSDGYVYAEGYPKGAPNLVRVLATGGPAEPVYDEDAEVGSQNWSVLPGGQTALFTAGGQIRILRLESGEAEPLTPGSFPRYAPSGHLVYLLDGTLMAARFDADQGTLLGPPVAVLEENVFGFSLSDDGKLVYMRGVEGSGREIQEFVWVSRSGQAAPAAPGHTFALASSSSFALSPDETRIAFNIEDPSAGDVWIKHIPEGPEERITFSPDLDYRPLWSPDGQNVMYFSGPTGEDRNVYSRRADGTGDRVLLLDDVRSLSYGSSSPDGEWLVVRATASGAMGLGQRDILAFRPGVDSAAMPLVATPDFVEQAPAVSPDGRWLAYLSNETGRQEVFVRPFPNVDSTRVRVSTNGAINPVWARSGRELFFVDDDRGMVAAQFDPATGRVLALETLFVVPADYVLGTGGNKDYDVSSDGERFLMARLYGSDTGDQSPPAYILVLNFDDELKRLVPN